MQPSVPAEFTCLVDGAMQPFDLGLLAVVNTILGGWPPGNWSQAAICEITPVKSPSRKAQAVGPVLADCRTEADLWVLIRSPVRVSDDPDATRVDEWSPTVRLAIMPSIASSLALGFDASDIDETST
jgi:hypothetical protein